MSEKPIIFSGPMVKAIQERRKTVTRRPIKKANILIDGKGPAAGWHKLINWDCFEKVRNESVSGAILTPVVMGSRVKIESRVQPGDVLWVKEKLVCHGGYDISYDVDGKKAVGRWRWKRFSLPAMFMPKWAARLWPSVIDTRPERLQDITPEEAVLEGFADIPDFMKYWDSLYKKKPAYHSDVNPWVWRYEFGEIKK